MDSFLKDSATFFEQLKAKFNSNNVFNVNNFHFNMQNNAEEQKGDKGRPVPEPMDPEEFRKYGKEMVDFVADYWKTLRDRKPLHDVKPGYIWDVLPDRAPEDPEEWSSIFKDIEKVVLNGTTHWHHPHFHAYYPSGNSYPSIMGDILSGGIGCIGFTWNSSPACTELEMGVTDWVAKMLNLPSHFLNSADGDGAGMIQTTASESTLVALLAARNRAAKQNANFSNPFQNSTAIIPSDVLNKLVAYCSDQAHSSVERAALLGGVNMKKLNTNEQFALTAEILEQALSADISQGLIPFFVCVTLGSTPSCAFDHLQHIGPLCRKYNVYLHVDAAYAGSAFICPEYRYLLDGVEYADSFNFNPAKWMMVNMDCSLMWFKNAREVEQAFLVDPLYLKHEHQGTVPDYRNLQIPLGRRFRSLKLWFVLRSIGVKGLQDHIRKSCALAREFKELVESDDRFEITAPVILGLVCFRMKGTNELNQKLLLEINQDRRIHMVPSQLNENYILRFAICSTMTNSQDILYAWNVICEIADQLNK